MMLLYPIIVVEIFGVLGGDLMDHFYLFKNQYILLVMVYIFKQVEVITTRPIILQSQ